MKFRAMSPLPCTNWGSLSQKAINELLSPSGKSKGVRFLATIGGFLSHKPITPSHKSQTAGGSESGAREGPGAELRLGLPLRKTAQEAKNWTKMEFRERN